MLPYVALTASLNLWSLPAYEREAFGNHVLPRESINPIDLGKT